MGVATAFLNSQAPPLSTFLGLNSTRAGVNFGFGGNPQIMSRSFHVATDNIDTFQYAEANGYYGDNDASELFTANTNTVRAGVEFNGGFKQLDWSSGLDTSVVPGAVVRCSPTPLPSRIPKGSGYWLRRWLRSSGGTCVGYNRNPDVANGDLCNLNASTDQTMGGTITGGSFWSAPFAIFGQTNQPSAIVSGDSLTNGATDETSNLINDFRKGMVCHGFPLNFAFLNHGSSGIKASNYIAASAMRRSVWDLTPYGLIALGRNDFDAGATSAALISSLQTLIIPQYTRPQGCTIIGCTIPPLSSSTSGRWEPGADQAPNANNGPRVTYNTALRNKTITGISDFLNPGASCEDVQDSGIWLGSLITPNLDTNDGRHFNAHSYPLAGAFIASDVLSKIH